MRTLRTKVCRTCGETKTVRGFYRHPTYADGYMSDCKVCKCKYQAEMHELKAEVFKAKKAARAKLPKYREQRKAYAQTERGRQVHRAACARYNRWKRITTPPRTGRRPNEAQP